MWSLKPRPTRRGSYSFSCQSRWMLAVPVFYAGPYTILCRQASVYLHAESRELSGNSYIHFMDTAVPRHAIFTLSSRCRFAIQWTAIKDYTARLEALSHINSQASSPEPAPVADPRQKLRHHPLTGLASTNRSPICWWSGQRPP